MATSPEVTIKVEGTNLDPAQEEVVSLYQTLIETFIKKNEDYGNSYVESAAVHSRYQHGEVTDDLVLQSIAEQIWVRMLDKQSRTHQLLLDGDIEQNGLVADESVDDTLTDWANYAVMLAAQCRLYDENPYLFRTQYEASHHTSTQNRTFLSFENQTLTLTKGEMYTAKQVLEQAGVDPAEYRLRGESEKGHKVFESHEVLHPEHYTEHDFTAVDADEGDI